MLAAGPGTGQSFGKEELLVAVVVEPDAFEGSDAAAVAVAVVDAAAVVVAVVVVDAVAAVAAEESAGAVVDEGDVAAVAEDKPASFVKIGSSAAACVAV